MFVHNDVIGYRIGDYSCHYTHSGKISLNHLAGRISLNHLPYFLCDIEFAPLENIQQQK